MLSLTRHYTALVNAFITRSASSPLVISLAEADNPAVDEETIIQSSRTSFFCQQHPILLVRLYYFCDHPNNKRAIVAVGMAVDVMARIRNVHSFTPSCPPSLTHPPLITEVIWYAPLLHY